MYELSKSFRFETAHRLAKGYEGKCANIHGHSWNGSVTLRTDILDEFSFGIDYGNIKIFYKDLIDELDHSILLYRFDTELIDLCKEKGWKYMLFDENPTSECIAKYLFEAIKERAYAYDSAIELIDVTIEETCTSKCVYYD
tara:strand:+ start:4728 stop:5150 length:423 start_codon:yes stop_codon:yes gene_type:complete